MYDRGPPKHKGRINPQGWIEAKIRYRTSLDPLFPLGTHQIQSS